MTEAETISRTPSPATEASLLADLRRLGDVEGGTVLVHSSLSSLGWVAGGEQAVVSALLAWLGPTGTLVVPTHSGAFTDPARWGNPPVPEDWWQVLYDHMPAYDPATSPTRGMGAVVECVRHLPGAVRSSHPHVSFAAVGPRAVDVVRDHSLADGLGDQSPLAALYDLDTWVLLLGVGHVNNTSLHLAEYRCGGLGVARVEQGSPVLVDGSRRWVTYSELDGSTEDFEELGADFGEQVVGPVAQGEARLMRQRALVDFAVVWMAATRATVTG